MTYLDREREYSKHDGGGGNAGRIMRRLFENPENPLGWSLKLFTVDGITVRLHLIYIIYVVSSLLWSIPSGNFGVLWTGIMMACLFTLIVLHEFGHCYACRYVGGEANRVVMLPWGGLALCAPPHDWKANFITTFGGPGVNIILLPVFIGLLMIFGLGEHVVFNPFTPGATLADPDFSTTSTAASIALATLWLFHFTNFALLAFNVLLIMFPFDGGRLMQALIWRSAGYRRATEIAVLLGFGGAIVLGIFGLVADHSMLVMIAVFGALSSWMERRRLYGEFEMGDPAMSPGSGAYVAVPVEDDKFVRLAKKQAKAREQAAKEQAEVDRILSKIATEGMASLSRSERKTLESATKKKRAE